MERFFSLDKRCNGAGLIMAGLAETTLSDIAMSVYVTNLFSIPTGNLFLLFLFDAGNYEPSSQLIILES